MGRASPLSSWPSDRLHHPPPSPGPLVLLRTTSRRVALESRMTSFSTTAPSFTSFPDAPAFDSFPAQDGKKRARKRSRSRSERQDDNERTRRKDKRRSSPRDGREDATSSRKEHRAVETLQLGARASDSDDRMASSKRRSRHHGSERGDRPRDGPDRQSRNDAASDIQTSERKRHSERRDEKRRRRRSSSPNVRARNIISADEVC